jgi:hypothetical protein
MQFPAPLNLSPGVWTHQSNVNGSCSKFEGGRVLGPQLFQ